MNKIVVILSILIAMNTSGQSFAPAAGQVGSTAIHKDSSVIVNWASGITLSRGYMNIANPSAGLASFGEESFALGIAEGDGLTVVSLGDSGVAILTFPSPITNLAGPDFAVFENGFTDNYMEFAHVEVSSDGINYFRFPSISEIPLAPQMDNFSYSDCRYVNNLAGKYRQGYGTPFDLEELSGKPELNINAITHVKLIDVIGSVNPSIGSTDALGNLINDSYPTEFASGGFDLDAVAVLHELLSGLFENEMEISLFPNPTNGSITISTNSPCTIEIINSFGQILHKHNIIQSVKLDLGFYSESILFIRIQNENQQYIERVVVN